MNMEKLDEMLTTLGHRENHLGTAYLREAVPLYAAGNRRMTKELYPAIAKGKDTTAGRVERCIRHSIAVAVESCDPQDLYRIFGGSIHPDKGHPTNGEYIARLARVCRE